MLVAALIFYCILYLQLIYFLYLHAFLTVCQNFTVHGQKAETLLVVIHKPIYWLQLFRFKWTDVISRAIHSNEPIMGHRLFLSTYTHRCCTSSTQQRARDHIKHHNKQNEPGSKLNQLLQLAETPVNQGDTSQNLLFVKSKYFLNGTIMFRISEEKNMKT